LALRDDVKSKMLWLKKIGKAARYKWMEAQIMRGLYLQIKAMRKQRGWSQKRLAREAGISVMVIWNLEHLPWISWPSIKTLTKLAAAFDVALIVRFAPWSEMVTWALGLPRTDKGLSTSALCPKNFKEEMRDGSF